MRYVLRKYAKAKFQGCDANQQVSQPEMKTLGGVLAAQLSGP